MKKFSKSILYSALGWATVTAFNSLGAVYQVVDLSHQSARESFATGVNNNDQVVGMLRGHYNFPIDFVNFNMDLFAVSLASAKASDPDSLTNVDIDEIRSGIINADSLTFIRDYLSVRQSSDFFQKIGNQSGFLAGAAGTQPLDLLDVFDPNVNDKTRSTFDLVNAINDDGIGVATSTTPYQVAQFTPAATETVPEPATLTYWVKDKLNGQGVVFKGDQRVVIPSPESQHGGESYLTDISNSGYVVGYAAASITQNGLDNFETSCSTTTGGVDTQICLKAVYDNMQGGSFKMYHVRAYRWKIDLTDLSVLEAQDLGLTFTPLEGDLRTHSSVATGVNEIGHVAGYSADFFSDVSTTTRTLNYASYFNGESWVKITQPTDYIEGKAFDINDNNIVVGYSTTNGSPQIRKFFHYDGNSDTVTYPGGFFETAASEAYAVNNNGQVIGKAEIETNLTGSRREHGFLYDIQSETLTDLNTLTSCDSPYTIVDARDINDSGVIVGVALRTVNRTDAKGEVILDSTGAPEQEDRAVAVKLVPIAGGTVDSCTAVVVPTSERQGGGFGFYSLLMLLGVFYRRQLVR